MEICFGESYYVPPMSCRSAEYVSALAWAHHASPMACAQLHPTHRGPAAIPGRRLRSTRVYDGDDERVDPSRYADRNNVHPSLTGQDLWRSGWDRLRVGLRAAVRLLSFGYLDRIRERQARRRIRRHPAVLAATREIERWLSDDSCPYLESLEDHDKQAHTDALFEIAVQIVQSQHPRALMRQCIANYVARASRYDVLRPHPTEVMGNPPASFAESRVSWQLSCRVGEIALEDRYVRNLALRSKVQTVEELLNVIAFECELAQAFMSAVAAMRSYLDDGQRDPSRDWLRPIYIAMCSRSRPRTRG